MLAQHVVRLVSISAAKIADEVVGLRPALSRPFASEGSGSGSVFALRIFWAMVSASSVRLMRE